MDYITCEFYRLCNIQDYGIIIESLSRVPALAALLATAASYTVSRSSSYTIRELEKRTYEDRHKAYVTPLVHDVATQLFPDSVLSRSPKIDTADALQSSRRLPINSACREHAVNMHCEWGKPSKFREGYYDSVLIDGIEYRVSSHTYLSLRLNYLLIRLGDWRYRTCREGIRCRQDSGKESCLKASKHRRCSHRQ